MFLFKENDNEYTKSFTNYLEDYEYDNDMLFTKLHPQKGLGFLYHYLLEDDMSYTIKLTSDMNAWIIHKILLKYSNKYRKEFKIYREFILLKKSMFAKSSLRYKLFKFGFYGKRYKNLINSLESMTDNPNEYYKNI